MAILDWLKEAPLSAIYKERIIDSEKQISALEKKVAELETENEELKSQLSQSENKNIFKLKFGIYWDKDKNSFCPVCKCPVSYGDYVIGGTGYKCFQCNKVFPLCDSSGIRLKPDQVFSDL